MKIDFGDPVDFKIPLAKFPISSVSIELMANRATIKVFVLQTAHDQMVEHVNQDKNIECGGVLVGYPFQDMDTKETFVVIVGIIPDISSDRSVVHFTVTPETISRTREVLEKDFPELIAVGWYHSHPGHGVFLSGQDMTIVRGIYNEVWNLAWVIDPIRKFEGVFSGADGDSIITKNNEHDLFGKNSRIWFSITNVPQCILELQAGKISYSQKETVLENHKTKAEYSFVPVIKPHRRGVTKNSTNTSRNWILIVFFLFSLILLSVSLIVPGFLGGAILVSVLSILASFYVLLHSIFDDKNRAGSIIRKESVFALIMLFSLSFFWILAFLVNYIGVLLPIMSVKVPMSSETPMPSLTFTPTETPTPSTTPTLTEMPASTSESITIQQP